MCPGLIELSQPDLGEPRPTAYRQHRQRNQSRSIKGGITIPLHTARSQILSLTSPAAVDLNPRSSRKSSDNALRFIPLARSHKAYRANYSVKCWRSNKPGALASVMASTPDQITPSFCAEQWNMPPHSISPYSSMPPIPGYNPKVASMKAWSALRLGLGGIPEAAQKPSPSLALLISLIEQAGVSAHFHSISAVVKPVEHDQRSPRQRLSPSPRMSAHTTYTLSEHDIGNYDSLSHVMPPA